MHSVKLRVYDLSQGMARVASMGLIGRQVDGIWCVVPNMLPPIQKGVHHYGHPVEVVDMGSTEIPHELFAEYLEEIGPNYAADKYHLLDHNCNTFTNEVCQFLVGSPIPSYISNLPRDFLETPFGRSMRPLIDSYFASPHAAPGVVAPEPQVAQGLPTAIRSGEARHAKLHLPRLKEALGKKEAFLSAPAAMWAKFKAQAVHAPIKPPVSAETASRISEGVRDSKPDFESLNILRQLLKAPPNDESWIFLDVVRVLLHREIYTRQFEADMLAVLERPLGEENVTPFLRARLRSLTNVMATSGEKWIRPNTSHRTQLTAILVSGLLSDDTPTVREASALAFNVAHARFMMKDAERWSADGSDEEWAVEVVGALAHALVNSKTANEAAVARRLYCAICGLMYTAPDAILDLLKALDCTPESSPEHVRDALDPALRNETRSLFRM